MKVLLIFPPFGNPTQVYSSLPCLTGFLKSKGIPVSQWDLNIDLIHECLKPNWVEFYTTIAKQRFEQLNSTTKRVGMDEFEFTYLSKLVPYFPYFNNLESIPEEICKFPMGTPGSASYSNGQFHPLRIMQKYLSIVGFRNFPEILDFNSITSPHFRLPGQAPTTRELIDSVTKENVIDDIGLSLLRRKLSEELPDIVGISVPYADQLGPAFKLANMVKKIDSRIVTILGGAFINVISRDFNDTALFNFFDLVTIDAGEWPLLNIVQMLETTNRQLVPNRLQEISNICFLDRERNQIVKTRLEANYDLEAFPAPDFDGVPFKMYLSHRDDLFLPIMLAHGCYWKKCSFCDLELPYVNGYMSQSVQLIVEKMISMVRQTCIPRFHFVDEALPPKILKGFSNYLISNNLSYHWYGNVRLERAFTREFCRTLRTAGCIKVNAGLESCSDRILELMNKGITNAQAEQTVQNFSEAGIKVHTYLILGFPTETMQEAELTLQRVRDMIARKMIHSVAWHPFGLVTHSAISRNPGKFGIVDMRMPKGLSNCYTDVVFSSGLSEQETLEILSKFRMITTREIKQSASCTAQTSAIGISQSSALG
jgi:Radical SAM superfamily